MRRANIQFASVLTTVCQFLCRGGYICVVRASESTHTYNGARLCSQGFDSVVDHYVMESSPEWLKVCVILRAAICLVLRQRVV